MPAFITRAQAADYLGMPLLKLIRSFEGRGLRPFYRGETAYYRFPDVRALRDTLTLLCGQTPRPRSH